MRIVEVHRWGMAWRLRLLDDTDYPESEDAYAAAQEWPDVDAIKIVNNQEGT